jgi:hypothetical protein
MRKGLIEQKVQVTKKSRKSVSKCPNVFVKGKFIGKTTRSKIWQRRLIKLASFKDVL